MVCLIVRWLVGLVLVVVSSGFVLGTNYTAESGPKTTTKANFKTQIDDYVFEEGWPASKRQIALTKLEEYLVKNVKTDDPEKNLKQVMSKHSWLSRNVFKSKEKKQLWMEYALAPFEKLASANGCDQESLGELKRFAYYLHLLKERSKSDVRTRLVSLVRHYGARLADMCEPTYPDKIKELLLKSKRGKLNVELELMSEIIDQELIDWMKANHHDWITNAMEQRPLQRYEVETPPELVEKLKERVRRLRRDDPDYLEACDMYDQRNEDAAKNNDGYWQPLTENQIKFEKISFMLRKHFVGPCRMFEDDLDEMFREIQWVASFHKPVHNEHFFDRQPKEIQDICVRRMLCKNVSTAQLAAKMVPEW